MPKTSSQSKGRPRMVASQFLTSAFELKDMPRTELPEIAFAGRSNVGKSSLMNRILNRRNLVKVSSRPGFTQSLNFFLVNNRIHFVDLPGYGFAKAPKHVIDKWHRLVEGYLEKSRWLKAVVCIMDIRRRPDVMDLELLDYLRAIGRTPLVVLNKADKISQPKRKARLNEIRQTLPSGIGELYIVSAKTGEGIPLLIDKIFKYCDEDRDHQ